MPADLPCPAVRDVFVEKTAINQRQRKGMLKAFVDLAPKGKNQIKAHHTTPYTRMSCALTTSPVTGLDAQLRGGASPDGEFHFSAILHAEQKRF